MDILPSFLLGKVRRPFSLLIVILLTLSGLIPILLVAEETAAAEEEIDEFQPLAPKRGERAGD